jgi:hypothetical protein
MSPGATLFAAFCSVRHGELDDPEFESFPDGDT